MMAYHVLQIFTVVSMLNLLACNDYQSSLKGDSLQFPFTSMHKERFGNQMPPHHEPDAVLINVDKHGIPFFPEEYPNIHGGPRIFGNPRSFPDGPEHTRRPLFPNIFGFSGFDTRPGITVPGMFGIPGSAPRISTGPPISGNSDVPPILRRTDIFDISRSVLVPRKIAPNVFKNARDPNIFNEPDISTSASGMCPHNWFVMEEDSGFQIEPKLVGLPGQGIANNPAVFFRWGQQDDPFIPKEPDMSGMPDQLGPPISPFPREPTFRTPNIFSGVGSGKVPFPIIPWFLMPRENPNPERRNGFDFEGIYPNPYTPKSPFLPDQPENTNNSGEHLPRREVESGSGERETHNTTEDIFPINDRSPLESEVQN